MLNNKLLAYAIKVPLAHLLEPVADIFLDEFVGFLGQRWEGSVGSGGIG